MGQIADRGGALPGVPQLGKRIPIAKRLVSNTKKSPGDGCWEWTGLISSHGYGKISWLGRSLATHRAAWELEHGKIPTGLFVCHSCDNRACVRVSHLFLGTHRDNMSDMVKKGRAAKVGCPKLTFADVARIRELLSRRVPQKEIAAMHGVSRASISNISRGFTWSHV